MSEEIKTYGQIAYEAYRAESDGKSLVSGQPLPAWDEQDERIAEAWMAAGRAVDEQVRADGIDPGDTRLGGILQRLGNLAAGMELSASASRPSKKSEIEQGCADAIRDIIGTSDPAPASIAGDAVGLVLSELTLSAIQAEATRAHLKHGEHSMLGKHYSSGDRLAILVEEVGEVAHELTYDQGGPGVGAGRRDELVRELIQVAAMAASWVEFLEGGHR